MFKHLAVVYTANPKTDEVDRIFDKVRKELKMSQKNFGVDTTLISLPDKQPAAGSSTGASTSAHGAEPAKAIAGADTLVFTGTKITLHAKGIDSPKVLTVGYHTLYVQEKDSANNWSALENGPSRPAPKAIYL